MVPKIPSKGAIKPIAPSNVRYFSISWAADIKNRSRVSSLFSFSSSLNRNNSKPRTEFWDSANWGSVALLWSPNSFASHEASSGGAITRRLSDQHLSIMIPDVKTLHTKIGHIDHPPERKRSSISVYQEQPLPTIGQQLWIKLSSSKIQ